MICARCSKTPISLYRGAAQLNRPYCCEQLYNVVVAVHFIICTHKTNDDEDDSSSCIDRAHIRSF